MNTFNYFHSVANKVRSVPLKNQALFDWSAFMVKQAGLSKAKQYEYLDLASQILQDDQKEHTSYKIDFKKKLQKDRARGTKAWVVELADFPCFLFVYTTCINVIYSQVLVPLLEHTEILHRVDIGPTLLLQSLFVYLIYKFLLTYMATNPKRSALRFWIVLIAVFALYLGAIYLANQLKAIVWFSCPLLLWSVITGLLCFGSVWLYFKKEDTSC